MLGTPYAPVCEAAKPKGPAASPAGASCCLPPAAAHSKASFTIPAYAFDRGNAKTFTAQWADAAPMIGFGGLSPTFVEYDVDLPVAGQYTLSIFYSAAAARPQCLRIDGKELGACCRAAFGSWNTSTAKWEEAATLPLGKGKHTIGIHGNGAMPHLVTLRCDCDQPFPTGWTLKRPTARKLNSPPATPPDSPYQPDSMNVEALRRALDDLAKEFGERYPRADEFRQRLAAIVKENAAAAKDAKPPAALLDRFRQLQREALLANPLLDFDQLLLVKRGVKSPRLGLPQNWQSNCVLPKAGFDDEIAAVSLRDLSAAPVALFRPSQGRFVGDLELHFDAQRMLFSMVDEAMQRWQLFEINIDGGGLRQITGEQPDVDSYDACYLPDGRIIFSSTACFVGVPCVYGSSHVANLYIMDADGQNIRQLCFDQEHDWCPTLLNNGRVMYTRWEYTDTPHSNTRLLFHMNPDGTEQMEYLGSNSYWPNGFFYARPIPNHPTKVVAVISGHHGDARMGQLVVFDPARGRWETTGAVQQIPGYGKPVERVVRDQLTVGVFPKFLHPYPLSEKYFLVACKPTARSLWGLYLVDVFDNMLPLKELPGYALFEPTPLRKTPRPPQVPDKVDLARTDAVVYLPDIYAGDGLKGVPRGTVKQLRLFTYHYSYQGMGGLLGVIGMDGPWDIKRVLGAVPVYPDGSAKFRVPANTPISLQPLDAEGKALQLMRSWMTAMPGETVQCAGCHEKQNTAPKPGNSIALNRLPDEITPWRGPTRGFSYAREVQPAIDRYCIGCHSGKPAAEGGAAPNLRGDQRITDWKSVTPGNGGAHAGKFSVGYAELHRFVRRPGIESPYYLLDPLEFHADATRLVQLLRKGHYGAQLDAEAWDRLTTWIDLNCPFHGTWGEELAQPGVQRERRRELLKLYANVDVDHDAPPAARTEKVEPLMPSRPTMQKPAEVVCPNWPFDATEARRRQQAASPAAVRRIELAPGVELELSLIPAGQFVMGSRDGDDDERPQSAVAIQQPFWLGRTEITNGMFACFDPTHDSREEDKNTYQFGVVGYPANRPEQPVVRVSWREAMAFCSWLSGKAGQEFTLPSEAQWEWAARAGSAALFWHGDCDADFSPFANLADATLSEFASNPYTVDSPLKNPTKYDDWIPKDARFRDGALLTVAPGRYQPNPWGLFDMHGNAAEWTRSERRPYPYRADDGRESLQAAGRRVVRGGSWRDRPKEATASFRLDYWPYQKVYNVGFRVMCLAQPGLAAQ